MTCVVGLVDSGSVYIGGDSAAASDTGGLALRADPKVFFLGNHLLVGCSGSFRLAQLIRFELLPPPRKKGDTDHAHIVRRIVPAIRKCLAAGGFEEECGGNLILGYRGRLYELHCDFDVGRPADPYCAIGSGEPVALGAMYATVDLGWSPEARITTALEAAERHNAGVAAPFTIEVLS
ncbi:MAG: hypothetical protein ACREXU_13565 [Gammaproteobacteria bacterium]